MKKSTPVVFLLLCFTLACQVSSLAAPFHVENIVLKNFQAIAVPNGARIVWEFSSEERDITCNLEKSADGVNFFTLSTIQLASTRQQALHAYIDKGASGQSFYRLRITKTSYLPYISPIVSLNILQSTSGINNPGTVIPQLSSFFGELSQSNDIVCVRLVDLRGQSKMKQFIRGTELERVFKPAIRTLPAGYYVLNINSMQNQPLFTRCIYKF